MLVIVLSIVAGIVGTGLGGVVAVLIGNNSDKTTCGLLSFAGGVMISIVCFGLIPEAREIADLNTVIFGIILGIILTMILSRWIDTITDKRKNKLKVHTTHTELYHQKMILSQDKPILKSGIIMLAAIGLHNIPEGMAIGAGSEHTLTLGILIAVMIALHNIPEGMAISAPLLAGGVGKAKVIVLAMLSGAPTLIGAIIGLLIGSISDIAIAIALSIASGAMLYVVFGEIIPQSVIMRKDRFATVVTLIGIIVGLLLTQI